MSTVDSTTETRTTSALGGQKGVKAARYDLIPVMPLAKLAEHFGAGAQKYEDNNWRKGYEINKNIAALYRHLALFQAGEIIDEETGTEHLSAVAWHAFVIQENLAVHGAAVDDRAVGVALPPFISVASETPGTKPVKSTPSERVPKVQSQSSKGAKKGKHKSAKKGADTDEKPKRPNTTGAVSAA